MVSDEHEDELLLPLSALQHYEFCPRQCMLIHSENVWTENRHTAEGRLFHERTHEGDGETRGSLRIARGLRLYSPKTASGWQCGSKRKRASQCVQNSVFECLLDPAQWVTLTSKLEDEIDPSRDSLRYYFLGANWKIRVEHVGAKPAYDPEGTLFA